MGQLLPMHDGVEHAHEPGTLVGSVLYDVMPEHVPGLVVMVLAPLAGWVVWRLRSRPPLRRAVWLLSLLSPERRVAIAALALSGAVHAVIVPAHGWSLSSLGFLLDAVLLFWAASRLLHQARHAHALASVVLAGSLLGLAVSAGSGETPDQVAMACKLVELIGLIALWSPLTAGRGVRVLGTIGAAAVAVVVATPVWGVALQAGGGGHHGEGGAVPLATLIEAGPIVSGPIDGAVTAEQQLAADQLFAATSTAISAYADPGVAAAQGYRTDGIRGTDFHAENPSFKTDGLVLDPARPENLIYAEGPRGLVLLGAMFETEEIDERGPAVGGPLTMWHNHEQVCFGLFPPSLAGATSAYGLCPAGSVTLTRTGQMLHVWTVPGAPERFGDLPEEWLTEYLASTA